MAWINFGGVDQWLLGAGNYLYILINVHQDRTLA